MKHRLAFFVFGAVFTLAALAGWWGFGRWRVDREKRDDFSRRKTLPPSTSAAAGAGLRDPDRWLAAVAAAGSPSAQGRAAVDLAAALDPVDFARMIDRAGELPGKTTQELFVLTLLHRWIAVDPKAAIRWCETQGDSRLEKAVADWTERDPKAAEAYVSRSAGDQNRFLSGIYFKTLARKDPAAAYAALAARHTCSESGLYGAFRILATADLQRLLAAAETFPSRSRSYARIAAAEALAKLDLASAMAWIGQQPDGKLLARCAIAALPDIRTGLDAWKALPKAQAADALFSLSSSFARRDPVGTLTALGPLGLLDPDSPGKDFAAASLPQLASRDAAEAVQLLATLHLPAVWRAEQTVALEWSRTDPKAALEWARTLPEGRLDPSALAKLTARAAAPQWDPSPVSRYVAMAQRGEFEYGDFRALATPEQRAEALDALAQPKAFPDESWRAGAEEPLQEFFPAEYAAWLLHQSSDPNHDEKMNATVRFWANDDPRAAAAWIADQLPPTQQPPAINRLLDSWQSTDPDAAKAWFRALPDDIRKAVKPPANDW